MGEPFKAALVMDMRTPRFVESSFLRIFQDLSERGFELEILFLEASGEALLRRFSQTRRQHPLAEAGGYLHKGIKDERRLLAALPLARHTLYELRQ